jgi:hypothetical protein
MARKFYKTIIQVEVLSEDEPISGDTSLTALDEAITDGPCSGVTKTIRTQELNGQQAAKALIEHGSDPMFFGLNPDGSETEG